MNFRITVDLSNFFADYRGRVKIFVNDKIKTVKDVEDKLKTLFEIDRFCLTSGNEYLPPSEDIRILQSNELLCAIPIGLDEIKSDGKKSKKRKTKHEERELNETYNYESTVKKKKKKLSINADDYIKQDNISAYSVKKDKAEKKNKQKSSNLANNNQSSCGNDEEHAKPNGIEDISSEKALVTTKVLKNNSDVKHEYKCKGDLTTYVKKYPVPTITHEYLSEKKINIVKIDVVKNSSQKSEDADQSVVQKSSIDLPNIYLTDSIIPIDTIDKLSVINSTDQKVTPVEKEDVNHNTDSNIMFTEKRVITDGKKDSTDNSDHTNRVDGDQTDLKPTVSRPKYFFFPSASPSQKLEEDKKSDRKNKDTNNQSSSPRYFKSRNPSIAPESTPTSNEAVSHEKSLNTPPKTICKENATEKEMYKEVCLSDISGLLSVSESSSMHKSISAMSGLEDLPSSNSGKFPRPKQISGLGHVLQELKSQHSSPCYTTGESDCSQIAVTKRKRKRVRRRKTQKPEANLSTETALPETSYYSDVPMNTKGCPSLHIKYEYDNEDDDNMKIVKINEDSRVEEKNLSVINLTSDQETMNLEEDILKAPLMENILPKIGDIIAFKILRITENYTPEVSEYISGRVVDLENNSIGFDVIVGLDQCQQPSGKFSVENDNAKGSKNVGSTMSVDQHKISLTDIQTVDSLEVGRTNQRSAPVEKMIIHRVYHIFWAG